MNIKTKNIFHLCLCIIVAFLFLAGISYAKEKKGPTGNKERKSAPEFKYDENAKKYILDTPKYLAEFMPSGFTYMLKKDGSKPVTFSYNGLFQEEEQIKMPEASSKLNEENKVLVFTMKNLNYVYESLRKGFAQIIIIEDLSCKDKDLVIKAHLSTEYSLAPSGEEGFSIKDGEKTISIFKQRAALDSKSKRLPLKTFLQKDVLEITVPKDYLSEAEFPIVITSR